MVEMAVAKKYNFSMRNNKAQLTCKLYTNTIAKATGFSMSHGYPLIVYQ